MEWTERDLNPFGFKPIDEVKAELGVAGPVGLDPKRGWNHRFECNVK